LNTLLKFVYNQDVLPKIVLPLIPKLGRRYGINDANGFSSPGKQKKIVVEFSSPSIAKPFDGGYLRGTIIGGVLSNLYEGAGWETIRMNYISN
jgi:arginyl-tRNA synthetase